jgi:hypothetical protein
MANPVDLAKKAFKEGGNKASSGITPAVGRELGSTTSFVRMIVFHFNKQDYPAVNIRGSADSQDNTLSVSKHLIEKEVVSLNINKNMNQAAGTFNAVLLPTKNWRKSVNAGDWVAIYMFKTFEEAQEFSFDSPNAANLVMLGNVDRVSRVKEREEDSDKITVRYRVSGRDFGKVFENTNIWFNPYQAENFRLQNTQGILIQKGLDLKGNPSSLVNAILDVFLGEQGADLSRTAVGGGRTESLNQWLIPGDLLSMFLPVGDGNFFNEILDRKIQPDLPGFKLRSMITPESNGNLWNYLKNNSNDLVNDIYVDLQRNSSGYAFPSLVLRPRPTSVNFDDTPGKLNDSTKSLQDLAEEKSIDISDSRVRYYDLGKDEESRFNMVWLEARQSKNQQINSYANVDVGKSGNIGLPMLVPESITRNGLKMVRRTLEFVYTQEDVRELSVQVELFRSFINQVQDQYFYNHLYDTGTIVTEGNAAAELGQVLRIRARSELPPNLDKIYYIEGYTHTWNFPSQWETEFHVTMGQWNDRAKPYIDIADEEGGKDDEDSISQTIISRLPPTGTSKKLGPVKLPSGNFEEF